MKKPEILIDHKTNDVVVIDKTGAEVFRRAKTTQSVSIANAIYMFEKYGK